MEQSLKLQLARIAELKAEVDKLRPLSREQEERIFQKFRLDWNYHSNAIEGNKLTHGETTVFLLHGLTADGKPLKDHLDIRGHDAAIDYLLQFIRGKDVLTEAAIRELHKVLLHEPYKAEARTPEGALTQKWVALGEYKSVPNQVTTAAGVVRRFALPEETPARMRNLVEKIRAKDSEHPLLVAAAVHHSFVDIHPFDDGNGRMARILMNLILMQHGFPPIVIKTSEREKYFGLLGKADEGDIAPFTVFLAEKLTASLELYLRGARGEPLEDEDDVDKKIALLKQELRNEPEPTVYSNSVYQELLETTVSVLLERALEKLTLFNEFYLHSLLTAQTMDSDRKMQTISMSPKYLGGIIGMLKQTVAPAGIHVSFEFRTFKKAGMKPFDTSIGLDIRFHKVYFEVEVPRGDVKIQQSYGSVRDISREVANALANSVYAMIEKHRSKLKA